MSEDQAAAFADGTLPAVEQVRAGIWAVPLPMPYRGLPYSLSYLLKGNGRELHVIDTGLDSEENWHALTCAIKGFGHAIEDVATLTITHLHPDHAGLAARLRSATGATVRMHTADVQAMRADAAFFGSGLIDESLTEWEVPEAHHEELRAAAARRVAPQPFDVDELLTGGEVLEIGLRELRVLHTPGHTSGHIVLVDDDADLVFTGDHVLPAINPGIGLGGRLAGDDPIGDYLTSLEAVADLGDHQVCPGHGYRFTGLADRCLSLADHHRRRTSEVAEVLGAAPDLPVWDLASRLTWTAGWANLRGPDLLSALAQTAMHAERVRRSD